jgi:hypothetical protein
MGYVPFMNALIGFNLTIMIENDLELEIKTQQLKSSCPPGSPMLADDIARCFAPEQLPASCLRTPKRDHCAFR